jgi:hypothetical protein
LILLKLDNPAAWNLVWGPALLVVVGVSLIRPGPIPREYLLIGLVIAIMGLGPGTGARVASLARFEVIALPTFVYLAWLLRTRGRLWAGVALVMFLFQMMYAFRLAPGKEFGG